MSPALRVAAQVWQSPLSQSEASERPWRRAALSTVSSSRAGKVKRSPSANSRWMTGIAWPLRRSARAHHPAELAAAEDVDVEMGDFLVRIDAVVGQDAVAGVGDPEIARDLG